MPLLDLLYCRRLRPWAVGQTAAYNVGADISCSLFLRGTNSAHRILMALTLFSHFLFHRLKNWHIPSFSEISEVNRLSMHVQTSVEICIVGNHGVDWDWAITLPVKVTMMVDERHRPNVPSRSYERWLAVVEQINNITLLSDVWYFYLISGVIRVGSWKNTSSSY